jgi:hypothetical protein
MIPCALFIQSHVLGLWVQNTLKSKPKVKAQGIISN